MLGNLATDRVEFETCGAAESRVVVWCGRGCESGEHAWQERCLHVLVHDVGSVRWTFFLLRTRRALLPTSICDECLACMPLFPHAIHAPTHHHSPPLPPPPLLACPSFHSLFTHPLTTLLLSLLLHKTGRGLFSTTYHGCRRGRCCWQPACLDSGDLRALEYD